MILYPGRIEENNLGDIIINILLIRELSKYSKILIKSTPNQQMLNLMYRDNEYSENIQVYNISQNYFIYKIQILKLLFTRKIDYSFETPGHICSRSSKVASIIKLLLDIIKVYVYNFFGVKYIQLGITLGPYSSLEWFFVKHLNKLSYLTAVRDVDNFESLKKKGLNVSYIHDLAFLLYDNILIDSVLPDGKFDLGISLRGSLIGHNINDKYFNTQIIELGKIISKNIKNINSIVVLYQVNSDEDTSAILFDYLKINFPKIKILFNATQLTFDNAISSYKGINYLITNRLHVYLVAMLAGCKSMVLTDLFEHKKLVSIIQDMGLKNSLNNSNLPILESEYIKFNDKAKGNKESIQSFISSIMKNQIC